MIEKLTNLVLAGGSIGVDDAKKLSEVTDKEALYDASHKITAKMADQRFDLCSITNVKSGLCSENCKWCAQSKHYATDAEQYDVLSGDRCVAAAAAYAAVGVGRHSLVASGRRASKRDMAQLCENFSRIAAEVPISLCASLGLLDDRDMMDLKAAGVTRYHCNLESAPSFFATLCTTHSQSEKIATIAAARGAGLEVCSGGIIGMGESMDQRLELAFTLRDLGVNSIPINLLQPIVGTPLQGCLPMSDCLILTTIAMFRFINPTATLRFAGGRLAMSRDLQQKALYVGVNAAIAGNMLTTKGEDIENDKKMIEKGGYRL